MFAGTLTTKSIFEPDRRYIVPLFQRPYVWTRSEQWEPLWEDIRGVAERLDDERGARPHFLGAVVLDQQRTPAAEIERRLVIDGQQRLTTMQLLLEAFADYCENSGIETYHRALRKLTRNDNPLSDNSDEVFKVWPTNVDQQAFCRVMDAKTPAELTAMYGKKAGSTEVGHAIADAYLFFYAAIASWIEEDGCEPAHRTGRLYETLKEYIRLVVIDLGADDDPQVIFETLNARGTPLLPSDLVKNYLFHQAQAAGDDIDGLYRQYWQPFDDEAPYWRAESGRGHARRARVDTFLQNYLTLRAGDDVAVAHLYTAFRGFVARSDDFTPRSELSAMEQMARVYRSFDSMQEGSREAAFFSRLRALDVATVYPFLMVLFSREDLDRSQLLAVLQDLESFLIRRMLCQLSARGYSRLFVSMIASAKVPADEVVASVREFLLASQAENARWPDDEEFGNAWLNMPVYRILVRERVRMLLEALDGALFTGKTEQVLIRQKLTIEHLLPQSWRDQWPLSTERPEDQLELAAERERLLHTMGNLTLVTDQLNPALSNGPWAAKLPELQRHSALALNRQLGAWSAGWDEGAIEDRGRRLLDLALAIWPRPTALADDTPRLTDVRELQPERQSAQAAVEDAVPNELVESDSAEAAADNDDFVRRLERAVAKWEASGAKEMGYPAPDSPYPIEGRVADCLYLGPNHRDGWVVIQSRVVLGEFETLIAAREFYREL